MFSWWEDDEIEKNRSKTPRLSVYGETLPVDRIFWHNLAYIFCRILNIMDLSISYRLYIID